MRRLIHGLVLLAAFGLWSAVLTAQPMKQQTSNKDAVVLKATPVKIEGAVWEFELVFDTHAQELNDDLLKNSALMAADGTAVKPTAWHGDPPSGHHRKGVLRFNALNPPPDVLELRITRANESSARAFRWTMPRR